MYSGGLKPASNKATWVETIELTSVDDGELVDLTDVTEITLNVRNKWRGDNVAELSMSNGDIIIPTTGVIQWRLEAASMAIFDPKTYEVGLLIQTANDDIQLFLGTVEIKSGL